MASNETGLNGWSAVGFVDEATSDSSVFGDVTPHQPAVGNSEAALASAGAAVGRVEREIDHLWRDSMAADDRETSERLAEVARVLQGAALLLGREGAIG